MYKATIRFEHLAGDFYQLGDYGCVNVYHVSLVSLRKWGWNKGKKEYNILVRGTNFAYKSSERFPEKEAAYEVNAILDVIAKHKEEDRIAQSGILLPPGTSLWCGNKKL
jgi:hypothetical protein